MRPTPPLLRHHPLAVAVLGTLATAPSAVAAVDVTVQPGDTLWSIASPQQPHHADARGLQRAPGGRPASSSGRPSRSRPSPRAAPRCSRAGRKPASTGRGSARRRASRGAGFRGGTRAPGRLHRGAGPHSLGHRRSQRYRHRSARPCDERDRSRGLRSWPEQSSSCRSRRPARRAAPGNRGRTATLWSLRQSRTRRPVSSPHSRLARWRGATGCPSGLAAAALAWQESGFNNGVVSAANARGVMQILPGTWTWVEDQLAGGPPLDPSSPARQRAGGRHVPQAPDRRRRAATSQRRSRATTRASPPSASAACTTTRSSTSTNVQALRSRFGG